MSVGEGEFVTVLGPSGSGKSTALRLIAGLEDPDRGCVRIAGAEVSSLEPRDRGVGMVFQNFALFPHMTVVENVGFGLVARKVPKREIDARVRETAAWLGLERLLGRHPRELSGGERQRVALARALVGRPRILLMDEPLSNLDAGLRAQLREEIRALHLDAGSTTVFVTHDQTEALSLGRRMAVLKDGRLQQYDRPAAVYDNPANLFVARFVGSPPMNLVQGLVDGGVVHAGNITAPFAGDVSGGREVVLGFRPEAVSLDGQSPHGFEAILEHEERVGHERIWHLRAGPQTLTARPRDDRSPEVGERVPLRIDPDRVRLFDAGSGNAL